MLRCPGAIAKQLKGETNNYQQGTTTMHYTEITSHPIACKVLGIDPNDMPVLSEARQAQKVQVEADTKLKDWADAINKADDDFKPRFAVGKRNWRPLYYLDASGLRFDYSHYGGSYSLTHVGSRLCFWFRSKAASDYFAEKTMDLVKQAYYGK